MKIGELKDTGMDEEVLSGLNSSHLHAQIITGDKEGEPGGELK